MWVLDAKSIAFGRLSSTSSSSSNYWKIEGMATLWF